MTDDKPNYGTYAGIFTKVSTLIGLIGLLIFFLGIYIRSNLSLLGLILIIVGISIVLLFLWPGLGMILGELIYFDRIDHISKMKRLKMIENPQILDMGCGTGKDSIRIAKIIKNNGHLYGIDIYDKNTITGNALETVQKNAKIEGVQENTTFSYGSAIEIPFEDKKFDIVTVASVLHDIDKQEDKEKAISEIYRVLKPGGFLYLGEFNKKSLFLIAFLGVFSFMFKTKEYWMELLKNYNFKEIKYENISGFGLFTAKKPQNK